MKFKLNLTYLPKFFGAIILFLLVLNMVSLWIQHAVEEKRPLHDFFIRLFDFNQEANVPAFFSSLLLLMASGLLFLIYFNKKKKNRKSIGWLGLALVFVFLSLDEATQIHEFLIGHSREYFDASGYLYYAWIIPYSAGLLLLALIYIPFFWRLDKKMLILMILSGVIFIAGAIGMEMMGGNEINNSGFGLRYMIYYSVEETLEMIGVSIFIYSLIWYLSVKKNKITFKINPTTS
ncbi:hypothetical protein [Cyclobacterium sp.]|uniref:hypothetical protein n=1 Tax=Cyclobacterium sp. TaxID=1966343 RepID=UPI0019C6AA41|nr:hypothetical protein [Cyclobacterium sp.]MBD3629487.1 hypothetical protein [Cyclobacterium sp.]